MTRIYLPATFRSLRDALAAGELGAPPLTAFAVTPALREWYTEGDTEELEYAALSAAARASLRLLDLDVEAPRRRVVLAVDLPDAAVVALTHLDRAAVRVATAVPLAKVVSVHVDGPEAEADVRAAAEVVLEADLGSADAQFVVDGAEGHELLWYAGQEIPDLLA